MSIESDSPWPTGADIADFLDEQDVSELLLARELLRDYQIDILKDQKFRVFSASNNEGTMNMFVAADREDNLTTYLHYPDRRQVYRHQGTPLYVLIGFMKAFVSEDEGVKLDAAYMEGSINTLAEQFSSIFKISYAQAFIIIAKAKDRKKTSIEVIRKKTETFEE